MFGQLLLVNVYEYQGGEESQGGGQQWALGVSVGRKSTSV